MKITAGLCARYHLPSRLYSSPFRKLADWTVNGTALLNFQVPAAYALFEVKSMAEAIEWTTRFLNVLGEGECELRPIFEASDFAPEIFSSVAAAREDEMREEMQRNAAK